LLTNVGLRRAVYLAPIEAWLAALWEGVAAEVTEDRPEDAAAQRPRLVWDRINAMTLSQGEYWYGPPAEALPDRQRRIHRDLEVLRTPGPPPGDPSYYPLPGPGVLMRIWQDVFIDYGARRLSADGNPEGEANIRAAIVMQRALAELGYPTFPGPEPIEDGDEDDGPGGGEGPAIRRA
jgi:hypothetical protein